MNSFEPTINQQTKFQIQLTPAESFAAIMLAAVAVDGRVAAVELQNVMTTLQRTKMFGQETPASIVLTLNKLLKIAEAHDTELLLELAVPNLPEYLYETVFAIATDLTLADGAMFNEELNLLLKLAEYLTIPEATVDRITNVMMIKNRG